MPKEDDKEIEKEKTTEEKAEVIGKELGVDEKPEEVPDYAITEEGAEPPADERLGKERDADAKARLSNREKRQLRKRKLAEKFDAKDSLIKQQQEMINQLAGRINDVDGRLSQFDQVQLQQAWNDTSSVFTAAEQEYTEAFKTQDGAKASQAMRKMYDAQKRLDELQTINTRLQARPAPAAAAAQPDARVKTKALEWSARNAWFDPKANDDDSAIANTIATKLVKDGFDAATDEYWDELDQRLAARGISTAGDEEEEEPVTRPVRRSPPVNGSSGRGDLSGKTSITLPTAYINNLKEGGYWDDPIKRNKMIKRYLDGLKERSSEIR